jgi:hypothetical protein
MTMHRNEPTAGSHDLHDRLLISAHAAGDLAGRERQAADALLAACEDCRNLHADLLTIVATTHTVPAPFRAPARDFRISPERAATLARGGLWRRLLRPFARPGGAARPLSLAFTTLGVAGLLLAALPTLPLGGGDALMVQAPEMTDGRNAAQPTEAPEFVASPGNDTSGEYQPDDTDYGAAASPDAVPGAGAGQGTGAGPTAQPTDGKVSPTSEVVGDGSSGPSPLVLLSVAFLAAGLGLVLLRLTARQLR